MKKLLLATTLSIALSVNINAQDNFKRHEVAVGYGLLPTSEWANVFADGIIATTGLTNKHTKEVGAISLSYNYLLTNTWGIGGVFSFASHKKTWEQNGSIVVSERYNYIAVMPRVKSEWLHSNYLTLYSAVSLGIIINPSNEKNNGTAAYVGWQLSPIGIEIGKSFAGFAELGIGQMGIIQAGVRARF